MLIRRDDADMFCADCHRCGRRELRGTRSLHQHGSRFTTTCRGCGAEVLVAALPGRVHGHRSATAA